MVYYEQHIHEATKDDLVVKVPEEFLNKSFTVKVEEEPLSDDEKRRKLEETFAYLDTLKIEMPRDYKFDRDEANER